MPARCWPVPVLAAAALIALSPLAPAQDKKEYVEVQFKTADGVELQGAYHKAVLTGADKIGGATAEKDAPVVMLLHPFLGDPKAKEWDGLARVLAARGFHVLRFDFRGHDKSTVIDKKFWDAQQYPENSGVFATLARTRPLPGKLENALLKKTPAYHPMLVNDIIAARIFLDSLNKDGSLNTSSVYTIAVGDACPLALMYLTAEWTRRRNISELESLQPIALPQIDARSTLTPASTDIAATILVAPTYTTALTRQRVVEWSNTFPEFREKYPILCLHGDGDTKGKAFSDDLAKEILIATPKPTAKLNKLPFTYSREIKKSKLTGVDLLNSTKAPETEELILKYLKAVEDDRKVQKREVDRNWREPPYLSPAVLGVKLR